jgi:A/G-specific adenine glycosylase
MLLQDSEEGRKARDSLLKWFDSVSSVRAMPWRKPWINPQGFGGAANLRRSLERRAYEVWISEIMLQQTRVAVVVDYWNRWMAKWPTIQDLAAAEADDVLAAWRGLGYYSRATRIHEAAKKVVQDPKMKGLLPERAEDLEKEVPGVGRYTAGAISAIVFGHAAPMVDGNVLRVLCRQLGIFGNVKTDKAVVDTLWAAADALVQTVARDPLPADQSRDGLGTSDRPGRWGQALMELGSTVCTPKPNCTLCPISATCRAYEEGMILAAGTSSSANGNVAAKIGDMEDFCTLCEAFEDVDNQEISSNVQPAETTHSASSNSRAAKQATLSSFAFTRSSTRVNSSTSSQTSGIDAAILGAVMNHARKFPVKAIKKTVRAEEVLVCAIRRADGFYLLHRRPEKGLLAGLWELPSHILPSSNDSTPAVRKQTAKQYVGGLLWGDGDRAKAREWSNLRHDGELATVPWLFSHLKLAMHVHLFTLDGATDKHDSNGEIVGVEGRLSRWSDVVDQESMGTGMRKCWALVKDAVE